MSFRRAFVVVALLLVVAFVAAACGDDDGGAIDTSGGTTTSSSAVGASTTLADEAGTTDGIDPMNDASTSPVSVPAPANGSTALLAAIRASRHEGYDRVVFDFGSSAALPGYKVSYVDKPVIEDGSGKQVSVAGDFVVTVRMEPASGVDLSKSDAPQTYTGPTRFDPRTPEVAEIVRAGDFEGVLTWAVGVRDKVDFRVTTLSNPARLVVDFRNH